MHHLAYLTAIYKLGLQYHSGQWSKGYRLLCIADKRAKKYHSALDLGRIVENLDSHKFYRKGDKFRNLVAFYLNALRKYRKSL